MNFQQWAIVVILLAMLVAYASERFRVETVAITGLAAGYLTGVVPVQTVFSGFSSPALITVVEILIFVSVLSRTRIFDDLARGILARTSNERAVLAILCSMAAFVSVFMNNIGALALFFPVALSVCARLGLAPGRMLMPLSFATLLGGTCSLTGTPANLVINDWKVSQTGSGFSYFELGLLGGPVMLAGLAWIIFAAPWILRSEKSAAPAGLMAGPNDYLTEAVIAGGSALIGQRITDAEEQFGLHIHGVIRRGAHVFARRGDILLAADDRLLVEVDIGKLDALCEQGALSNMESRNVERIEAVVMPDSVLLGSRLADIASFAEQGVTVAALASRRHRVEGAFGDLQIGLGDIVILSGDREVLGLAMAECGLLPLSRRASSSVNVKAGPTVLAFVAGVVLCAFDIVQPALAFGAVILALVFMRSVNLRTALQDLNWPIVILLGCMIPLGTAVEQTGVTNLIANGMASTLPSTNALVVAGVVLLMAVVITPFIDNVSAAIILSPIAAGIATRTGLPVEPLLMVVALGVSLDFLTPFGHHNNAVVMGAAGYRFSDFPRFGAPLLVICYVAALLVLAGLFSWSSLANFSHPY